VAILYRLIRDLCLVIIIAIFFTEDPITTKLIIGLSSLVMYFFMSIRVDSAESNKK